MSEPERAKLSVARQMLKQNVARRLRSPEGGLLWQPRYYDFILRSACLERGQADREVALPAPKSGAPNKPGFGLLGWNPVKRGLVRSPEDWAWSSFRHYLSGVEGVVEIESQWTARNREQMGVAVGIGSQNPRPVAENATRTGHPRELR